MFNPPTYLFAGGGSGGHLFPGLAVATEIRVREPRAQIVFVGSERSLESDIIRRHNHRHESLSVEPSTTLRRNPFRFFWRNWNAKRQAHVLLDELQPAAVIGLGGYASVPLVLAAWAHRVPVILLEQNIIPGRATRWLSSRANLVCLSFEQTRDFLPLRTRTLLTGNPVRKEIAALHNQRKRKVWGVPRTLVILGGSQGAAGVNEMVLQSFAHFLRTTPGGTRETPWEVPSDRIHAVDAAPAVEEAPHPFADWMIQHQTGIPQHESVVTRYNALGLRAETAPFFGDMPARYSQATLVVTRGGATTLAELAVAGVPAIVVPHPGSIRDHQRRNADYYAANGAAIVIEQQPDLGRSIETLKVALCELAGSPQRLQQMSAAMHELGKPDAASAVVDQLPGIAKSMRIRRRSA